MPTVYMAQSTLEREKLKFEKCCHCGMEYVYPMYRKAQSLSFSVIPFFGGGMAADRAESQSYNRLQKLHEKSFDPVRCPGCEGFQPKAIAQLRVRRAIRTLQIGLLVIVVCGLATLLAGMEGAMIGYVVLAIGVLSAVAAAGWWVMFDPSTGKNYLCGVSPKFSENVLTLEAHEAMVEARLEARAQEEEVAQERRAATMLERQKREEAAQVRKRAEMESMAQRAKRSISDSSD